MRIKKLYKRHEKLLFPPSLEEKIQEDSIVRLIDAFVDSVDIESLGFTISHKGKHDPGAPEYHPSDLLKIYLYGYINRTRSSRQLARCCKLNIEMMWLINGLTPEYVTIANFRRKNTKGLKSIFRIYNKFLQGEDLFGGETIAVDGSKIRAQNSKKNNFSDKSIERHQKYIDKKTNEYLALLEQSDQQEKESLTKNEINEKLDQLAERKVQYNKLQEKLDIAKSEGETQISTVDADARLFSSRHGDSKVAYNLQSVVDEKHKLIVHNEVTNKLDTNALYQMASVAKSILQQSEINVLADSGYFTGEEIKKCIEDSIITFVAPRVQNAGSKDKRFTKRKFNYNNLIDNYTCPLGEVLTTNGKVYTKKRPNRKDTEFREYKISFSICSNCEFKNECAGKRLTRNQGRVIERFVTEEYIDGNIERIRMNKEYYRKRMAIVEHPFGTIKRQWGYSYTLLKGLEKVGAEFDLICLAYNMRRSVSVVGVKELVKRLKAVFSGFVTLFHSLILPDRSDDEDNLLCLWRFMECRVIFRFFRFSDR